MRIVPAFFVLFICSAGVNAASIKIEFSGTFGTFCYSSCQEAGLDSLVGESFSASFIIPDQSSTPYSDDGDRAVYRFNAAESSFVFSSPQSAYNVNGDAAVLTVVQHCTNYKQGGHPDNCWQEHQVFDLVAETDNYYYSASFNVSGVDLFNDASLPTVQQLQSNQINALAFAVCSKDWGCVDNATDVSTQPTLDSLIVTAVPIPAAAWLFASGLGLLGWIRRSHSA
jgi:hypothetical protein